MKIKIQDEGFDTILVPDDWRSAAALTGLKMYFDFCGLYEPEQTPFYKVIKFQRKEMAQELSFLPEEKKAELQEACVGYEAILYKQDSITQERYVNFLEDYYKDDLQYTRASALLSQDEWSEEQIKLINDLLTGSGSNTTLKKVFGKRKFDGSNSQELLSLLEENRMDILRETFRNKKNMYANYANTNLLLSENNPHCRLLGYNMDEGRKSKAAAYQFNINTFVGNDMLEYDFIPFAFTNTYESFFFNNNYSVNELAATTSHVKECLEKPENSSGNQWSDFLKLLVESKDFLKCDIEVICKSRDNEYFKTLYVRQSSLEALSRIKNLDWFHLRVQMGPDYWLNVQQEVLDCCLNEQDMDYLVEILLKHNTEAKEANYTSSVTKRLIELNPHLKKGVKNMDKDIAEKMESARISAYKTVQYLVANNGKNKITSYRQKLTSALVAHDYDRVKEILLQLSNYTGEYYSFVFPLYEDFEANKDIAFAFANELIEKKVREKQA